MGRLGRSADLRGDLVKQEGAGVLKCQNCLTQPPTTVVNISSRNI